MFRTSDRLRSPLAGVPVAFYQPGGELTEVAETGEDGSVTAVLSPGGAVVAYETAVVGGEMRLDAWAVLGVMPGDLIPLGGRDGRGVAAGTMRIQLPALEGVSIYWLHTPCGSFSSGTPTVTIRRFDDCVPSSIVAVADLYGDRRSIAFDGLTFEDGGILMLPGSWTVVATRSVAVTNIPLGTPTVGGEFFRGRLGGATSDLRLPADTVSVSGDAATIPLQRPASIDAVALKVDLSTDQAGDGEKRAVLWLDGGGGDVALDAADLLLPAMGFMVLDAETREISWPISGEATWDATYAEIDWIHYLGSGLPGGHWYVAIGPGATSASLPPVPDEFAPWLPAVPWQLSVEGRLFDSDQVDGWEEARSFGCDPLFRHFTDGLPQPSLTRFSFSPGASAGP